MKKLKNLNASISALSKQELTTVKGGGSDPSLTANLSVQFQAIQETNDPPREIGDQARCSFL